MNVAKKSEVERLFAETKKAFGRIDVFVNNAGVYEFEPLEEITEEEFHREFRRERSRHDSRHAGSAEALRLGRRQRDQHRFAGQISHSAARRLFIARTKGAVDTITRTLAKELGPRKIRVNAINPGMVITEGAIEPGIPGGDFGSRRSQTPLGRVGQPGDIAPAAVFFASARRRWVTGETLRIAGGLR